MTCDKEYWRTLQARLANEFSTFSYDRSGLGKSDIQNHPKDIYSITSDLEELLSILEVKPPFIFVGHSFGGTLSKYYSHQFKTNTNGVVFIDPSDSFFEERSLAYRTESQKKYWNSLSTRPDPEETESEKQEFEAFKHAIKATKSLALRDDITTHILVCDNLTSWFDPEVDPYYSFDDAPKNILQRDNETWIRCHEDWLKQAPEAKLTIVQDSSHNIHLDNEEIVYETIRETVLVGASNKTL
ncbi:hypothetical protein BGK46_16870 [Salinivibrio sp. SS2]|nr:hypothetical protein BGK46_16870 [Salinivibrio sp. DV]